MLQQLISHHQKYRTEPSIRSVRTREKDYSDKQLFRLWEKELQHVNGDISRKMKKGVYSMDDRFDIAYTNLLKCIREIEKSVSTLPTSYDEQEAAANDQGRIIHPLFDLRLTAGDMINNTSICMGIFGQPLPPYPEMYKKLLLRDDRYGTG
jgi:Sec7-like guanine-nucleotide exchange factor